MKSAYLCKTHQLLPRLCSLETTLNSHCVDTKSLIQPPSGIWYSPSEGARWRHRQKIPVDCFPTAKYQFQLHINQITWNSIESTDTNQFTNRCTRYIRFYTTANVLPPIPGSKELLPTIVCTDSEHLRWIVSGENLTLQRPPADFVLAGGILFELVMRYS